MPYAKTIEEWIGVSECEFKEETIRAIQEFYEFPDVDMAKEKYNEMADWYSLAAD
jgi:hypothetical protein